MTILWLGGWQTSKLPALLWCASSRLWGKPWTQPASGQTEDLRTRANVGRVRYPLLLHSQAAFPTSSTYALNQKSMFQYVPKGAWFHSPTGPAILSVRHAVMLMNGYRGRATRSLWI